MHQFWLVLTPNFWKNNFIKREKNRKILENISWLFFERIVRLTVGLFVGSWMARYLGPIQYGSYNYAISVVALVAPFSSVGLDNTVIREIINSPEKGEELVNTAIITKMLAGVAVLAMVALWLYSVRPFSEPLNSLIMISGVSILIRPFDAIDFYFQAITNSKFTVQAKSTAFFCASVLKAMFIKTGTSVSTLMMADVLETLICGLGLCSLYQHQGHKLNISKFRKTILYQLLSDSWPLIISGSLVMLYMRIDQIMIANLLGVRETGLYAASVRIAEILYFVPIAIVSSTFPKILETRNLSEATFKKHLQNLYTVLIVISYVGSILLALFSNKVILKLYGPDYIESSSTLAILSWSCIWVSLGVARSSFLSAINRNFLHLQSVFIAMILNIGLNYVLIPKIGISGAGIATNISYCFAAYASCFFYKDLKETGKMMTKSIFFLRIQG
jgi:O-antigen/teichoic acid export membrane protein